MHSTSEVLDELNELSREKSSDSRREMLRRITDLFLATTDQQEESDTEEFGDVLETLAYALEVEARIELSDRIVDSLKAPRRLVKKLASDEIEVAQPLLERSTVLTDDDLVEIAGNSSQDHLMAMSNRETLAPSVTEVLVERGSDSVVQKVAENKGARFSPKGLDKLTDRSANSKEVFKALSQRADLPENFLDNVKTVIKKKLSDELEDSNADLSAEEIDSAINKAANTVTTESSLEQLQKQTSRDTRAYSEQDLIDATRLRHTKQCVHIISALTKLDEPMVRHCLIEADMAALAILCKAHAFKDRTFAAVLQLRIHLDGLPPKTAIVQMERYQNLDEASAQRVLRFLKVRIGTEGGDTENAQ